MLTSLVALLACSQEAVAPPPAAPIVSKMMAHYAGAKSLVGQIRQTATVSGQSTQFTTVVQYERPSLLYIKTTGKQRVWITSSTGKAISYDVPNERRSDKSLRLGELQAVEDGTMSIEQVYSIASHSQGDKSVPLDVAIGNKSDLVWMKGEWATLVNEGKTKIGDVEVNHITGQWRINLGVAPTAKFEMDVTDDGDLIRYAMTQDVVVDKSLGPQHIVLVWDCNLKVDAKPDPSLFQIYR